MTQSGEFMAEDSVQETSEKHGISNSYLSSVLRFTEANRFEHINTFDTLYTP